MTKLIFKEKSPKNPLLQKTHSFYISLGHNFPWRFSILTILLDPVKIEKISAPRGNSFREIVYGSPFICVLNILVGLFTHILIYLFIWSLVFSYGEDPYNIQPANSIQTILYCFIVISHLFHTLKFSIWTITTT